MIKAIVSDFSRVVLFPIDNTYAGGLNKLHDEGSQNESYNFWDHYRLNTELLNKYNQLRLKVRVVCFTTGHIQEYPALKIELNDTFERILTVEELGKKKNTAEAYSEVANILNLNPEEILFIDDTQENIEAAKLAGMQVHSYVDNELLFEELATLE